MKDNLREKVKSIVLCVLGVDNLAYEDNLFEAGIDSIGMLLLVGSLEKKFAVKLPITFAFELRDIDSIVRWLEGRCLNNDTV